MALVLETRVITDATQAQVAFKQLGQEAQSVAKPMQEAAKAVEEAGKKTSGFGKSTEELKGKLNGINPAINATRSILNHFGGDIGKVGAEILGVGKDVSELKEKMAGGGGLVATLGAVGLAVAAVTFAFNAVSKAIQDAKDHADSFITFKGGKQFDSLKEFLDKAAKEEDDLHARNNGFINAQDEAFANQIRVVESQLSLARRRLKEDPDDTKALGASAQLQGLLEDLQASYKLFNKQVLEDNKKRLDEQIAKEKEALDKHMALLRKEKDEAEALWKQKFSTAQELEKLRIGLIEDDEQKAIALARNASDVLIAEKRHELDANKISQQDFDRFVTLSAGNVSKTIEDIQRAARDKKKAADKAAAEETSRFFQDLAKSEAQFELSRANAARALASKKRGLDVQTARARESPFLTSFENQKATLVIEMDALVEEYTKQTADVADEIKRLNRELAVEVSTSGPFTLAANDIRQKREEAEAELKGLEEIFRKESALWFARDKSFDLVNGTGLRQARSMFETSKSFRGVPQNEALVNLNRERIQDERTLAELRDAQAVTEGHLANATGERAERLRAYLPLLREEVQLIEDRVAGERMLLGSDAWTAAQTEQIADTIETVKQVSNHVEQSLGDAVVAGLTGRNDEIKDIFRSLFTDIASDFTRLALNNIATALLGDSASPGQSGISGLVQVGLSAVLGSAAGGAAPAAAGSGVGPGKAASVSITNVNVTEDEASTVIRAMSKKPGEIVNVLDSSRRRLRATSRVA